MDNSIAAAASTANSVQPDTHGQRYSQHEQKKIGMVHPVPVIQYYKYIRGIDRVEQNISRE